MLRALRHSAWAEHKIDFKTFIQSDEGSRVRGSLAAQLGSEEQLRSILSALPALELYAPFRVHRLSWRANEEVMVGNVADANADVAATVRANGATISVYGREPAPDIAFLLLAPAESRGTRLKRQSASEGATIQDPDDGEVSLTVVRRERNGDSSVVDVGAQLIAASLLDPPNGMARVGSWSSLVYPEEDLGGGSGGGCGALPPEETRWMYLRSFATDGFGSAEIEISYEYHFFADELDILDASYMHRWAGVDYEQVLINVGENSSCGLLALNRAIHGTRSDYLRVDGVETDAFHNDYIGGRTMHLSLRRVFYSTVSQHFPNYFQARFDWVP